MNTFNTLHYDYSQTTVLYTGTSSLSRIPNFCKVTLMQLPGGRRTGLCHFIPISAQSSELHLKHPITHDYILHDHILETETSTKYLGVTLQNDLKWNKHIDNIIANASRQLNFLIRNLKVASPKIKERAYQLLVRPKLEYNSCTWNPHHQSQIHQLEMVQRRAARYVTNRFHNTSSVSDLLQDLNWPTLQQRRLRTRLIFFYKIIHNLVAIYPTDLLHPQDSRTRHSNPHGFQQIHTSKVHFIPVQ